MRSGLHLYQFNSFSLRLQDNTSWTSCDREIHHERIASCDSLGRNEEIISIINLFIMLESICGAFCKAQIVTVHLAAWFARPSTHNESMGINHSSCYHGQILEWITKCPCHCWRWARMMHDWPEEGLLPTNTKTMVNQISPLPYCLICTCPYITELHSIPIWIWIPCNPLL